MSVFIHATALIIGERAVLIRGASGAGKTGLAWALLSLAGQGGQFVRLVGDDRVKLEAHNGRLVVSPHPKIAGKIEQRGVGILEISFEPAAIVGLVIDLTGCKPDAERLPPETEKTIILHGIALPRLAISTGLGEMDRARLVLSSLHPPFPTLYPT